MLKVKAPAKINWFLKVHELRRDGYHEITSLMQRIGLYDVLHIKLSDRIKIFSELDIPEHENIVFKAAHRLRDRYRVEKGAEIRLVKKIPVAAGLGGGSSDAAAALSGLNRLWRLGLSCGELCKVAVSIGSDVPFFLKGPMALVRGRGEKIRDYMPARPVCLLLVKPDLSISTKWAYNELSVMRNGVRGMNADRKTVHATCRSSMSLELTKEKDKSDNIKFLTQRIVRADIGKNIIIQNDLEKAVAAAFPVLYRIKEKMLKEGAVCALMSGSGSTVFGMFEAKKDAENASAAFKDYWTAVVKTLTE